ncbi:hypothetical protein FACS189441_0020 [Betaproteobacteria bacterium]|nr:hypothetical protein FACS189441_0020 [Betaproteobacteria bacterium]
MNNYNKEFAFKAIKELVESGMKMMNNQLNEDNFQIWFDYSKKVLELSTKDNPSILLNYLRLIIDIQNKGIMPYQKLDVCLNYLIEMLRIL